jgi:hypothetical protein
MYHYHYHYHCSWAKSLLLSVKYEWTKRDSTTGSSYGLTALFKYTLYTRMRVALTTMILIGWRSNSWTGFGFLG